MPRAPRKIDLKEKAEAQGHYVIEGEEIQLAKVIYEEQAVVKVFDRINSHEDTWAIHELKDVSAVDQDGNIVNLLFCAKDGHTFTVRGQIIVDQEYKNQLRNYRKKGFTQLNGAFIQVAKPDNMSMGYDPLTLWISSACGWLEIKPGAEYREMYDNITHVIGVYFCAVVHTEDLATGGMSGMNGSASVSEEVQEIVKRYIFQINGAGTTTVEVIGACRAAKDFLLDQFRKKVVSEYWVAGVKTSKWLDCGFYRWVVADFPENPPDDLPSDPAVAKTAPPSAAPKPYGNTFKQYKKRSPTPAAAGPSLSASQSASPPASPAPIQQVARGAFPAGMSATMSFIPPGGSEITIVRWPWKYKETTKSWSRAITSFHGIYQSPEFPDGIQPHMHNADIFVVIACHAKACDRFGELKPNNLAGAFYWDFMCDKNNAAKQVLYYYAPQVAAKLRALGPAWKDTTLYKELLTVQHDPNDRKLEPKEVSKVKQLTKDGKKVVHRSKAPPRGSNVSTPAPAPVNLSTSLGTMSLAGTMKRTSHSPNPPAEKRSRLESLVSRSRDPSPVPEHVTRYDTNGKGIPKPIKKFNY